MSPSNNNFSVGSDVVGSIDLIRDSSGNPATFLKPPVWSSSNPAVFNPIAASDGLSATGIILTPGPVVITVVGDTVTETSALDATSGAVGSFQISWAVVANPAPPAATPPASA